MEQASHLLVDTDARIKDVALDVGTEDPHYFGRSFHKTVGLTPSEFRARARATAPLDRQDAHKYPFDTAISSRQKRIASPRVRPCSSINVHQSRTLLHCSACFFE